MSLLQVFQRMMMMMARRVRRRQRSPVKHSGPLADLRVDSGLPSDHGTMNLDLSLRVRLRMPIQEAPVRRTMQMKL